MSADIDIDVPDRTKLLEILDCTQASQLVDGQVRKHNSGVYPTDIPYDPINNCSSLTYEEADARGYFKLDLLNVGVYQLIESPQHYEQVLSREIPWRRLWEDSEWAKQLIHVGNYTSLLNTMRPDSIPRMAAFIAIIRPGKAHLQNKPWDEVFKSVWDGDNSRGFVFKKAHSVSYGELVALHMRLLDSSN